MWPFNFNFSQKNIIKIKTSKNLIKLKRFKINLKILCYFNLYNNFKLIFLIIKIF